MIRMFAKLLELASIYISSHIFSENFLRCNIKLCVIENLHLGFGSSILNFDELPFLSPLRKEGVTYLFRKPNAMPKLKANPKLGEY